MEFWDMDSDEPIYTAEQLETMKIPSYELSWSAPGGPPASVTHHNKEALVELACAMAQTDKFTHIVVECFFSAHPNFGNVYYEYAEAPQ